MRKTWTFNDVIKVKHLVFFAKATFNWTVLGSSSIPLEQATLAHVAMVAMVAMQLVEQLKTQAIYQSVPGELNL